MAMVFGIVSFVISYFIAWVHEDHFWKWGGWQWYTFFVSWAIIFAGPTLYWLLLTGKLGLL